MQCKMPCIVGPEQVESKMNKEITRIKDEEEGYVAPAPVNKALPAIPPRIGARNGKKASGCPVSGFTVIGIACAKPLTSAGLTWRSIESP